MAVYQFLGVKRAVPPVSAHDRSLRAEFQAVIKAFH
jgi:oleate hydratase